jgi:hypothetical protein
MDGFDDARARRATRRYAIWLAAHMVAFMALGALGYAAANGAPHDFSLLWLAAFLSIGCLFEVPTVARVILVAARMKQLYGRRSHGALQHKLPVLTHIFGFARIDVGEGRKDATRRVWCFGMPWQIRRLAAGAGVQVYQELRRGRPCKVAWLPFWLPPGGEAQAAGKPNVIHPEGVEEIEREILDGLAEALRPLDYAIQNRDGIRTEAPRLALQPFVLISLVVVAGAGAKEWLALLPRLAPVFLLAGVASISALLLAGRLLVPWALRSAIRRFDVKFPEGTPERTAALMILREGNAPSPAWQELRKALIE